MKKVGTAFVPTFYSKDFNYFATVIASNIPSS